MRKFKVKYVNHGIANRFPGSYIEIHKKLKLSKYKLLHDEILAHEKDHTDYGYALKDAVLDFKGFKNKGLYRKFILTTPSSWVQFSPIYWSRKTAYVDATLTITYLSWAALSLIIYAAWKVMT